MRKVRHFKIKDVGTFLLICQRHTILFFLHFWDSGAECLCPNYRAKTYEEAMEIIGDASAEQGFEYMMHE